MGRYYHHEPCYILCPIAHHSCKLRTGILARSKQRHDGIFKLTYHGLCRRIRPTGAVTNKGNFLKCIIGLGCTAANRIGLYAIEPVPVYQHTIPVALCGSEREVGVFDGGIPFLAIVSFQLERVGSPNAQLFLPDDERVVAHIGSGEHFLVVDP